MWIEICTAEPYAPSLSSRPARALWIEMYFAVDFFTHKVSRPARALWIEILFSGPDGLDGRVEAREGLVD